MTVLILGGTTEARALAAVLDDSGMPLVSSLAGRVRKPRLPVGPVRIGGFGGPEGLAGYLRAERIRSVVDATHPFAAGISSNAATACARSGLPLLRLQRPGWSEELGADRWKWVDTHDQAATAAAALSDSGCGGPGCGGSEIDKTVFLSTGRQTLGRFTGPLAARRVLVRVVEPLTVDLPDRWTVVHSRGPYDAAGERALMRDHGVGVLVTKDSGGGHTRAKLDAAGETGVRVIVVRRPPGPAGVASVDSVAAAAEWCVSRGEEL